MNYFTIRVKSLRKEKGKTQEEIGKVLGLQRGTFSAYERGICTPPYDKLEKLAEYFDVSVEYLMGTTNLKHYVKDGETKSDSDIYHLIDNIRSMLIDNTISVKHNERNLTAKQRMSLTTVMDTALDLIRLYE